MKTNRRPRLHGFVAIVAMAVAGCATDPEPAAETQKIEFKPIPGRKKAPAPEKAQAPAPAPELEPSPAPNPVPEPAAAAPAGVPATPAQPPSSPARAEEAPAQGPAQPSAPSKPRKGKAKAKAPAKLNGVAQAAAQAGVSRCVPLINQVTDFLTAQSQTGAFLFLPPVDADNRIASTSLEIQSQNSLAYASASFAPVGEGCGTLYETVAFWGGPCEAVAQQAFGSLKRAGALRRSILVLDGGPALRIFLMPAADRGCISIKKEVIY
jgi:hypothetical protein